MQNRHINAGLVIAAALMAFGIAAGGWFTGNALVKGRDADRVVTVKGVAE